MSTSTIIAIVEGVILLIIFIRWFNTPTPEEIEEKRLKKEAEEKAYQEQENKILNLEKPVVLINKGTRGEWLDIFNILVQDGKGINHHFFCKGDEDKFVEYFPVYSNLYNLASKKKEGDVLIPK